MPQIEYQRFKHLCNVPKGERRFVDECLGFDGGEQVIVFIETCAGFGLRYLVTSGIYLESTGRVRCDMSRFGVASAVQNTLASIRNNYSHLSTHAEAPESFSFASTEYRQYELVGA